jgi:hypothetical protein
MPNLHSIKNLLAEIEAARAEREKVDAAQVEAYEREQKIWGETKARVHRAVDEANAILLSSELSAYRFIYEEKAGYLYGALGIIDEKRHYHVYCQLHLTERQGIYYLDGDYFKPTDDASKPAQITAMADDADSIPEFVTRLLRHALPPELLS